MQWFKVSSNAFNDWNFTEERPRKVLKSDNRTNNRCWLMTQLLFVFCTLFAQIFMFVHGTRQAWYNGFKINEKKKCFWKLFRIEPGIKESNRNKFSRRTPKQTTKSTGILIRMEVSAWMSNYSCCTSNIYDLSIRISWDIVPKAIWIMQ